MEPEKIELPDFAKEVLLRQTCSYCKKSYVEESVQAAGIRRGKDGKTYFWYEMSCLTCKNASQTVLNNRPMDMDEMATQIKASQETRKADPKTAMDYMPPVVTDDPPVPTKSRITDAEVERMKDKMRDENYSHTQFLRDIGITHKDMLRYTKEGTDDKSQ